MAYDTALAERIDLLTLNWPGFARKQMFGGLGYLLQGNMAFGIWHEELVVRCGPERHAEALRQPGIRDFDVTGRPMKGWILIDQECLGDETALLAWLVIGRDFASSLPAKD